MQKGRQPLSQELCVSLKNGPEVRSWSVRVAGSSDTHSSGRWGPRGAETGSPGTCLPPAKPEGYSTVVLEPGDLLESEELETFASVGPHIPMERAIGVF